MRMVELDGKYFIPTNILTVFQEEGETMMELMQFNGYSGGIRVSIPLPIKEVVGKINDALSG